MASADHHHTVARPGESRAFHFESQWLVDARVDRAWEALFDVSGWSDWWPGVRARAGSGRRVSLEALSPLGFSLAFEVEPTVVEPPHRMEFTADGDLRGHGSWTCHGQGQGTRMEIVWCVCSGRLPIRLSRPLASWAHGALMRRGERGLRAALR